MIARAAVLVAALALAGCDDDDKPKHPQITIDADDVFVEHGSDVKTGKLTGINGGGIGVKWDYALPTALTLILMGAASCVRKKS